MENRKTFTFNGVNSADYGLYISGDSVYNAPSRVYDMVDIAGRNGQLAIDQGRFENIEVTYPAFIFAETQTEFAQRLREIRAWLMSPVGYQRLEDTYHPDEFRMAIYMSGLEADPTHYNEAGEFELTFNCKPQRFLKSGEEEIVLGEWGETETITGDIATFEGTDTTAIKSVVAQIVPKQEGTGDPSPTNVRPISGYDGVEVEQRGANLFNINGERYIYGNFKSGMTFYCQSNLNYAFTIYARMNGSGVQMTSVGGTQGKKTFTLSQNADAIVITQSDLNALISQNAWLMISLTDFTQFEPYQGSSHSIPFKDSQGNPITVYGGNMNITDGEGSDGMGMVDLGSLNWYYNATYDCFYSNTISTSKKPLVGICSKYAYVGAYSSLTDRTFGYIFNDSVAVRDSAYNNDPTAFKAAMNGVQLCYELATPTPIYCEPTEINTLLGVNNIWADSGEVSVEIGEDPNILVNPTPFEALPIFEVVGTGSLTVGNTTVTITGDSTQDIFIDSDIMEAYEDDNGAIISRNDRISLSGMNFPTLGTETGITNTGLTSVTVIPRWWTI